MNILIIDDDPVSVAVISDHVKRLEQCSVFPFASSAVALSWCETSDPDLVILDYLMPAPNGLEFIDLFRKLPGKGEIPLVMITADDARELRYLALDRGVNDFLCKPFDSVEFIARLRNMLSLRRKQKELAKRAQELDMEVRRTTASVLRQERETIILLSRATELRDPETWAHLQRMSYYSRIIAENLGLGPHEAELIFNAAPLHDIGKVGIPDGILLKDDRLDEDEYRIIQRHTILGHEILKDSTSPILRTGAEIALTHHERFDGSGYPHGLNGESIPLSGRIAAVADVFDALTSVRSYKQSWGIEQAADEIRRLSGVHFAPCCVEAFLKGWSDVLAIHESYGNQGSLRKGYAVFPNYKGFQEMVVSRNEPDGSGEGEKDGRIDGVPEERRRAVV
jgi:response regulator RpfG family c-di-GMP phosphodiesterase